MEAVDRNLPAVVISKSESEYQNSIWIWYEKLLSLCEKKLIPEWAYNRDQNCDNWPFY